MKVDILCKSEKGAPRTVSIDLSYMNVSMAIRQHDENGRKLINCPEIVITATPKQELSGRVVATLTEKVVNGSKHKGKCVRTKSWALVIWIAILTTVAALAKLRHSLRRTNQKPDQFWRKID